MQLQDLSTTHDELMKDTKKMKDMQREKNNCQKNELKKLKPIIKPSLRYERKGERYWSRHK